MPNAYKVARVGTGRAKRHATIDAALEQLIEEISDIPAPYQITDDGGKTWGPKRTRPEVRDRGREILQAASYGDAFAVRSADHPQRPHYRCRYVFESLGGELVRAALSQLGVPYVWADADPAGGASAGFDCSGLTMWVYEQAGVSLPHLAEGQHTAPMVDTFHDRNDLRQGDLVFYNVGRLPQPQADHVGIAGRHEGDWWVVDASSTLDRVVFRDIDSNPVLGYGFVAGVTHPE